MFAVAYVYSFVAQIATGKLWDTTHFTSAAILPVMLGALTTVLATTRLPAAVKNSRTGRKPQGPAL
jgi:hypothetical protein